ncbi:MAG TPA: Ig-like domain-containing protein [Vicinamibacteria bacterium]|jgi:hypothetical protein
MRSQGLAVHAMGVSVVAMSLLTGCDKGPGGGGVVGADNIEQKPEVQVVVAPQLVSLQVGETAQLVAAVANLSAGDPAGVRWASSNPAVASVDAAGLVSCDADGSADVSAHALASDRASGRAAITCTPAPNRKKKQQPPNPNPGPGPAPGALFALSTSQLSFQTQPFSTNCPLRIGDVRVSNTSGERASVKLVAGNGSIELTPDQLDLQAGMWHDVIVKYNCGESASFHTQITVTVQAGGRSETRRIEVRGTIQ